jgi:carbonic anhydrase
MNTRSLACAVAAVCATGAIMTTTPVPLMSSPAQTPQAPPAWHYEGAEGPANWAKLSPAFASCGNGRAQSPIDIVKPTPAKDAPALKATFPPAALRIVHNEHKADSINNGHTIQVNYTQGDTLTLGTEAYQLAQYHFHAPSEHTVNGKHFPMEMHMVHTAPGGKLAVIGIMINSGKHNAAFDPIWSNLPKQKGAESHLPAVKVDVDALLPRARTTYRYDGSLTTPPCSESVKWLMMTTPIELSASQIGQFTALVKNNNRPVQPLNGRPIVTDAVGNTGGR